MAAGDDNAPHTGTPDEGLHDDATSTDESDEGEYTSSDHGDGTTGTGDDDEGHYTDSDDGSGHHESHPGHGDYVDHEEDDGSD